MKKFKKFMSALCAVSMVLSLAAPAFAAEMNMHNTTIAEASVDTLPRALAHCQVGSKVGMLIEKSGTTIVGKQSQPCTDIIGKWDTLYQRQDYIECSCTLCAYYYKSSGNPYWDTSWTHTH